jgi:hypothetical protein
MPGDFLDTSALAKHYHPEVGSAEIDHLWNDPSQIVCRIVVLVGLMHTSRSRSKP